MAIKISGKFNSLELASTPKQALPYPSIEEVIKQSQRRGFYQVRGTLVGWYAPVWMGGIKSAGFHFHFIDETKKIGGHVLSFNIQEGHLETQMMNSMTVEFIT